MIITLCSSATAFTWLRNIDTALLKRGYEVLLPSMKDFHGEMEDALAKIQHDLIREHFRKIDRSDAIYVANFDKRGITGYIGGNTLVEMGHAFYREIPIFLRQDIPNLPYAEEIRAMQPLVIGEDWNTLDAMLRRGPTVS